MLVLERSEHLGGAAVSEAPFAGVDARLSRYSYLVSLLPRRIVDELGLRFETRAAADLLLHAGAGHRHAACSSTRPTPSARALARAATGDAARSPPGRRSTTARRAWRGRCSRRCSSRSPSRDELRRRIGDDAAWEALFERPIGEAIEAAFADDVLRGIVLTDALIGTFAAAREESLRQNRCFLYHVIGNGTGAWDVPVGGMGALTAELAALRRERRRRARDRRRGDGDRGRRPQRRRCASRARRARVGDVRHVVAGCAPAVLDRLLGRRPRRAARGRPAEGQHAAEPAAAAARPRRRAGGRVRRDVPRQRDLHAARVGVRAGRGRRRPVAGAVRDLLPLADRPDHPRPRPGRPTR